VTVAQLGAASLDNPIAIDLERTSTSHPRVAAPACRLPHMFVARQRGPPTPL
jgi:hypothetical protein